MASSSAGAAEAKRVKDQIELLAQEATKKGLVEGGTARSRDHFRASPFLWSLDPTPSSCNYTTTVLAVAGTVMAAELRAGGA